MGWLSEHRDHAESEREAARLAAWQQQVDALRASADAARDLQPQPVPPDSGLVTRRGEGAYLVLQGVALIDPRRLPGHYSARSSGFSFHVAKGVTYRVGGTRGTFQQGAEVPTPIDVGTMLVSDQRVVFTGPKQTREWDYSKLVGIQHDPKEPWTALQVSNRQKVSGVLYDDDSADDVRFRLELAVAAYNGTRAELAALYDARLAALEATRPETTHEVAASAGTPAPAAAPAPPAAAAAHAPPAAPADWYPQPDGTMRYWDGAAWTGQVATRDAPG